MFRVVLISTITALLLSAAGNRVGEALATDQSGRPSTAEAPAKAPEPADGLTATPSEELGLLSWAYWQQGGMGASRSEIVRNFGLLAAALIGLGFGIWRAYTAYLQAKAANDQARIAEQGNFTERFSKAAEHLGSPELPVRLGGIHALWRLARDSPERDVASVVGILCAFVRNPPHESTAPPEPAAAEAAQKGANSKKKLRPDVQTVFDLIDDKEAEYRRHLPNGYRLKLRRAQLPGVDLPRANLRNADLFHSDVRNANLSGANLTGADLTGAVLIYADLTWASFVNASLANAYLAKASLVGANFKDANFTGANLTGADLTGVIFEGARNIPDLSGAYADPNNPPQGLPDDVKRPERWEPRPER